MKKGLGNKAQARGHKRVAKLNARKSNKLKAGTDLKEGPKPGETYLDRILNDK